MALVNICNPVSGATPLCEFTCFTHTSWAPVEPNATGLPSDSLYVTAVRVIQETTMKWGYLNITLRAKYLQVFKLIAKFCNSLFKPYVVS